MRARLAILLLLVTVMQTFPVLAAGAAGSGVPHRSDSVLIQAQEQQDEPQESESGQPQEAGPPWTYQMARIGGALVLLLLLATGWWYYRLVVKRQRGEV